MINYYDLVLGRGGIRGRARNILFIYDLIDIEK